ncbi:MAG: GNAT family N-acetyltransferase [Peptococcaceae bacterium]|nr:GNAT family N-acetyltransferase [Peptococcaceae bacterium]
MLQMLFALPEDEEELREIFWTHGMDISGDITEHLVIKNGTEVLAGGKLSELAEKRFYLEVIGVKKGCNGSGYGGMLLAKMVTNPWECCKRPLSECKEKNEKFVITTLARGSAVGFYQKYGFQPCDLQQIPLPFRHQCSDCPEKENCDPVPMIMIGG